MQDAATREWRLPTAPTSQLVRPRQNRSPYATTAPPQKTKKEWVEEGTKYRDSKQFREAIAAYDNAIELDPQYAFAYYNRGNAYYMQEKYAEAIADYDRALALSPQLENAQKFRKISQDQL